MGNWARKGKTWFLSTQRNYVQYCSLEFMGVLMMTLEGHIPKVIVLMLILDIYIQVHMSLIQKCIATYASCFSFH